MSEDYPKQDGSQPGVLGDGTEEQNLGQPGNPKARITEEEVEEAFKDDKTQDRPACSPGSESVAQSQPHLMYRTAPVEALREAIGRNQREPSRYS